LATLNLDPAIPGFKIKLIRLVVFMVSHQASFTVDALLCSQCHKRVEDNSVAERSLPLLHLVEMFYQPST